VADSDTTILGEFMEKTKMFNINDSTDEIFENFLQSIHEKGGGDAIAMMISGRIFRKCILASLKLKDLSKEEFEEFFGGLLSKIEYFLSRILEELEKVADL